MTPFALDHPAVQAYLQRLDAATAHLPADERIEIAEGIRSHLITALGEASSEADVRTVLDALGEPEEIVGTPPPAPAQAPAAPVWVPPTPRAATSGRGALEIAAVIFLLLGAIIVPFVGWFIGVVLLWCSKTWTTGQKWLGTLVLPGGLAIVPALVMLTPLIAETCTTTDSNGVTLTQCSGGLPTWVTIAVALLCVGAPIATSIYLLRAAGRAPAPARR